MKKLKSCYHCGGYTSFRNRSSWKQHLLEVHELKPRGPRKRGPKTHGKPNVVHFGARMRKKLGLEYNRAGHLRSTLEPVEREAT